jgi:hypothetical protein
MFVVLQVQQANEIASDAGLAKGKMLCASYVAVVSILHVFVCWRVVYYPTHFARSTSQQVGSIGIDAQDQQGCSFRIEVLGRDYHLRATSRAICRDWVITLNRVKEARLQQGNVKLVMPSAGPVSSDRRGSHVEMTPRVVVISNRDRTKAVDEDEQWDEMMNSANGEPATVGHLDLSKRRSALQNVVLARWSKRNSSVSRLATKLARWARSLQKYSCTTMDTDNVQLDRHVHPPGHDDQRRLRKSSKDDLSNMYDSGGQTSNPALPHGITKPSHRNSRTLSVASEDDSRMIA